MPSAALIIGDPEQLLPRDFFAAGESREEEEIEGAPEKSILETLRQALPVERNPLMRIAI